MKQAAFSISMNSGPYNLMILGQPSHWRSEFRSFFGAGVTQTVTTMAPCSVLVARNSLDRQGFFICTDGSSRSLQAVRRSAVLATMMGEPVTLFSVAPDAEALPAAEEAVSNAKALLKAMKIDVADTKTAVGDVIEEIVERGSLYRMIVVTDEGRSRLERLLKGSRATDVVRLRPHQRAGRALVEIRRRLDNKCAGPLFGLGPLFLAQLRHEFFQR